MGQPKVIWVLGDGKPGHENQTLGVAEAMQRRVDCQIHRIGVSRGSLFQRLANVKRLVANLPSPDWILGAGHATHVALWWLGRQTGARTVVLMKPSLPLAMFDFCIAPYHDFREGYEHPKVLLVHGAPNRVVAGDGPRNHGLILIGGPIDSGVWDGEKMTSILDSVMRDGSWVLSDSRRTPAEWYEGLSGRWENATLVSHTSTGGDWIRDQMRVSDPIWVTEDSVSMICEAAASGARVGILPMPGARVGGRVARGIHQIIDLGFASRYETWLEGGKLPRPEKPLLEADRCAGWLLQM